MLQRLLATLRNLTRRSIADGDLDAELAAAVEVLADEKRQEGLSDLQATRQAIIELGGLAQVTEEVRRVRAGALIDGVSRDVASAFRTFRRSPGFAAVAVGTLAMGIGATTTVYSWVVRALLEPIPTVARQHELVLVTLTTPGDESIISMRLADFNEYRRVQRSFAGLYGSRLTPVHLSESGGAERLWSGLVTGDFFRVLGVRATLGRVFGPDSPELASGTPVAVISDALWRSRFQADPGVVGRSITLNGTPHSVIGVTPPGFVGGEPGIVQDLWLPMTPAEPIAAGLQPDEVYGRLKPGVSIAQAFADLHPIAQQLQRDNPKRPKGAIALYRLWQAPGGSAEILLPLIAILGGVVALVLILTCANVSNLLLTHAAGRQHEMAVRIALGAGRWQLIRLMGIESLVLACAGGLGGILIAQAMCGILLVFVPPIGLPIGLTLGLDWHALAFAAGVALATAVLVGALPAFSAMRTSVSPALNAESVWSSGARRGTTVRHTLVVAQVALSMVLLAGAGLFLRSLASAGALKPGFDPNHVLVGAIDPRPSGYDDARSIALFGRVIDRVKTIPGVESAAFASRVPLSSFNRSSSRITVDGYAPREGEGMTVAIDAVSADYFRMLRIPLRAGRPFSDGDVDGRPFVAVVNETMARRFWPQGSVLGRTFRRGNRTFTVVGVAANTKSQSVNEPPRPGFYVAIAQEYWGSSHLMVRTSGDPAAIAQRVREAVRTIDPGLPVVGVQAMTEHLRFAFFVQRVGGAVLAVVGTVATLLAALGLYGVMSYSVWRRIREFGVRMALGATPPDVWRLVVRQGVGLFAMGLPLGLAGSVGLGLAARSQLYGVSAADPVAIGSAMGLLGLVIVVAASIPAWRASRLNVVQALRDQQ